MHEKTNTKAQQVLIAAIGINMIIAFLYTWSVFSKELITQYHWTTKQASLPYTASAIAEIIAMVFFGRLADAKGPRLVGTLGAVLQGAGIILSGLTRNPIVMTITFGLVSGLGAGIMTIAATPTPAKWFPSGRSGLITGLVSAGVGVSSIIYAPIANSLLAKVGISTTFFYIGVPVLLLLVFFCQFLANPPARQSQQNLESENTKEENEPGESKDRSSRFMIQTRSFYHLWIMMAFASSAGLMIIGHAANIARVQIGWEGGFYLVILLGIFNSAGRILGGGISDRIGRMNLLRIIFAIQALNMLLFTQYHSIALLALGVAVTGICYGCNFSVFPASLVDLYGKKHFSSNFGVLYTAWGAAGIIGPMAAAAFVDASGSYYGAYLVAFSLMAISFLMTYVFTKSRTTQLTKAADGNF